MSRVRVPVSAAVVFLCLLVTTSAVGADLKIAFIDSERIFQEYKGVQEAQSQFDQDILNWKAQATEMKNDIEKLRTEIDGQRLMLSQPKLEEKEGELQGKIRAYEEFVQRIWGPSGELELRNEQLTKPIIAKIRTVVDRIGLEEEFTMILDAADGNIVFGDKELDLTDRVLEELGKME
ncbi:MAG: OmpH family outer membrane protein [Candidatus Eiseniibacteriota bacterium]|nr:MAG: OmpH family outer membrane protein [Candidatus Eisenbacteria bacterium]